MIRDGCNVILSCRCWQLCDRCFLIAQLLHARLQYDLCPFQVWTQIGGRTQLAGFIMAWIVALCLGVATRAFQYIPNNTLAAITIYGLWGLLEVHHLKYLWKVSINPTSKARMFCNLSSHLLACNVHISFFEYNCKLGLSHECL